MIFDLDLWPTDLNIDRDHLFIKDYLPTKFEASGAKRSWVINCTRWSRQAWPLTSTFDQLTWISIGIIYSWRTIYLQSLKVVGQSVLELSVHKMWETNMTFDLDLWPCDLNINRDHLIIMDYLPTKLEGCGAKRSWVISCTRWSRLHDLWPTDLNIIGIIYSSRTIHLPSLKLLGQNLLELSVAQGEVDWHYLWPWPLTYWPEYQ